MATQVSMNKHGQPSKSSTADTRQKLYLQMVSKFALKFGNDDTTLHVIESCLQARLHNKDKIEARDFDEIQKEVRRRLT